MRAAIFSAMAPAVCKVGPERVRRRRRRVLRASGGRIISCAGGEPCSISTWSLADQHPVRIAVQQGDVHQHDPGREHGRAQQRAQQEPPPRSGSGRPAKQAPQSQRRRQQQAFRAGVNRQGPGDAGRQKQPEPQFQDRPPTQVERQDQQEPKRRIADDQGAVDHQLGMQRVEQASDQGHLVVELPPQPAEQGQHGQARQDDAPALARPQPVQPRACNSTRISG